MKVAFIVSKFPCYDEAFILRELDALQWKLELSIISLRESKEDIVHDAAAPLVNQTHYAPYLSLQILLVNFLMLVTRPIRYVKSLISLIIRNIKSPEFLIKSLAFFPKAVYLADWCLNEGVEHVHAYWATYPTSVAVVIHELTDLPYSFTGHAHDIYLDTTSLGQKLQSAKFVTTCTASNKEHLKTIAPMVADSKIVIQHHGLDDSQFSHEKRKQGKKFEIISVGTLNYYKGFDYFIEAIGYLRERSVNAHATIIGGGPLENKLKYQIAALGLEKYITMTGPLKQSEVFPYYTQADLFVLMAQSEWHWGIPNVIIEALANKTAVITTKFGSVEELVYHNKTGLIVQPKNPLALADAMEELCRNASKRRKLALAGYKLVDEQFRLEKNINLFMEKLKNEENHSVLA